MDLSCYTDRLQNTSALRFCPVDACGGDAHAVSANHPRPVGAPDGGGPHRAGGRRGFYPAAAYRGQYREGRRQCAGARRRVEQGDGYSGRSSGLGARPDPIRAASAPPGQAAGRPVAEALRGTKTHLIRGSSWSPTVARTSRSIRLYRSGVSPAAYGGCLSNESQTLLEEVGFEPLVPLQVLSVSVPPDVVSVTLRRFPPVQGITLSRPGDR